MHANCVLLPVAVTAALGNLDGTLTHARGDIDYGLRASRSGIGVFTCAGIMGTCTGNPIGAWRDLRLPLRRRLQALHEPKYALEEKVRIARRHYGLLWFLSPLAVYLYIFLSQPLGWLQRLIERPARERTGSGPT
jgi:GT2 family glycosyltransferase